VEGVMDAFNKVLNGPRWVQRTPVYQFVLHPIALWKHGLHFRPEYELLVSLHELCLKRKMCMK